MVNLYVPNKGQISFLNRIWKKVTKLKQGRVILCDDFNLVPDATTDVKEPTPKKNTYSKIDLFLGGKQLLQDVTNSEITPQHG